MLESSRGEAGNSRPDAWPRMWHVLCAAPVVAVVAAFCIARVLKGPLYLEPLLAVPPALAGIGASRPLRPVLYGAVSLLTAIGVGTSTFARTPTLTITTIISVVAVTAVSAAGAVLGSRHSRKLAQVMTVAEVAQRALLRPLPHQVGPLELDVLYLTATAEARVGGDLYEVARTAYGIRMIMGDVRGKGLGAVEVAADVLGVFREAAHEVYTLAEVARRLDASLMRRDPAQEEFVTAVLVEVDPETSSLTIYNCGHPPPMILAPGGETDGQAHSVITADVPTPAPPLGLMSLGDCSSASRKLPFKPGDGLLLYTDGITEARDSRRRFYPLAERLTALARASEDGERPGLLERLKEDVLSHVGAPLADDAAVLFARAGGVPAGEIMSRASARSR